MVMLIEKIAALMRKLYKPFLAALALAALALIAAATYFTAHPAVLNPQGLIAGQQRDLFLVATALMLIVIIPVFVLTFVFAWRYRASNKKATYAPDWDHHKVAEFTWWALPCAIIAVLAVITWKTSNELDPYRAIDNGTKPITVQVVALQWKWLFIYPEQHIATVNELHIPEDTPINFEITADAPMNSFWIPELGGQVYAMAGMKTKLHLLADHPGTFTGSSANLSGRGFAAMNFKTIATSRTEFDQWARLTQQSSDRLTPDVYAKLAAPSETVAVTHYSNPVANLYDGIIMKYMDPLAAAAMSEHTTPQADGHEHPGGSTHNHTQKAGY